METLTLMLLVALAILWAGAGVYWFRTRVPAPSTAVGSYTKRLASLPTPRSGTARATVLPIHGNGKPVHRESSSGQAAPGYSLLPNASRSATPANLVGPMRPLGSRVTSQRARLRRRNVLGALAAAAVLTLLAALAFGGAFILAHLVVDAALLGFVLLVVQYQREIDLARTQHRPVIAAPGQSTYAATGTGSH